MDVFECDMCSLVKEGQLASIDRRIQIKHHFHNDNVSSSSIRYVVSVGYKADVEDHRLDIGLQAEQCRQFNTWVDLIAGVLHSLYCLVLTTSIAVLR